MRVSKGNARQGSRSALSSEAGHWLLRLQERDPDPQDPYFDPSVRNEAFLDWLAESPEHVQAFLEIFETYRRLGTMDRQKQIQIEALLRTRPAEVIRIYGTPERTPAAPAASALRPRRRGVWALAAAVAFAAVAASLVSVFDVFGSSVYTTAIGEQRTCKLQDGSMVYLNTDSRLEVEFTKAVRGVRLVRGEALFVVEHDTRRPFIVKSGDASVRAVGTQFDVKTLGDATDVAVVEGVVQVTVTDASNRGPSASSGSSNASTPESSNTTGAGKPKASAIVRPLRLAAGDRVKVTGGRVAGENASTDISDVMLWRQRRLKFRDTSLAEAAAEFNRYNEVQIVVDPSVPDDKRLTGIFDADRPQSFVLYAAKDDGLVVEPAGHHWIIRSR
jgi:transmembrane sensor